MGRVEGAVEEGELESKRKTALRITVTKWPYGLLHLQLHVQLLTVTQIVTTRLLYFEFRSLSLVIMIRNYVRLGHSDCTCRSLQDWG